MEGEVRGGKQAVGDLVEARWQAWDFGRWEGLGCVVGLRQGWRLAATQRGPAVGQAEGALLCKETEVSRDGARHTVGGRRGENFQGGWETKIGEHGGLRTARSTCLCTARLHQPTVVRGAGSSPAHKTVVSWQFPACNAC